MLKHLFDGGYIMLPLLALSILTVAIIIDRMRVLKTVDKDPIDLKNAILEHLEEGDVEAAIEECQETKGPIAAVMMVGLQRFAKLHHRGKPMVQIENSVNKTMSEYAPRVIETLEKRLNLLVMVGSVSPLLGMTGTVTGMIASFGTMSSGLDATLVSAGISEALVTTAAGLIVAIPAVVAHSIFTRKVEKHILNIEEAATDLIDTLTLDYVVERS